MAEPAAIIPEEAVPPDGWESDTDLRKTPVGREKIRQRVITENKAKRVERDKLNDAAAIAVGNFLKAHEGNIEEILGGEDAKAIGGGQHEATWKFRINSIPATQTSPCFILKTSGTNYPKQDSDLRAEDIAMRCVYQNTGIPVPRTYFGPMDLDAPGYDGSPHAAHLIAMECIEGKMFSGAERWSKHEKELFIRQLAAIRIHLIMTTSNSIGSVGIYWDDGPLDLAGAAGLLDFRATHGPPGKSGVMGGLVSYVEGRLPFRSETFYDQGPYNDTISWALACLKREIAFWTSYVPIVAGFVPVTAERRDNFVRRATILLEYLEHRNKTYKELLVARPREVVGNFKLSHGDLVEGNNLMLRGTKVVAVIDWETASFVPFSVGISDLMQEEPGEEQDLLDYNLFPSHQYSDVELMGFESDGDSNSDEEAQNDGVSMYGHSDDGTYDDGLDSREILPVDWFELVAVPSIRAIVLEWLVMHLEDFDIEDMRGNGIVQYLCFDQLYPNEIVPEFSKKDVVQLITKPYLY